MERGNRVLEKTQGSQNPGLATQSQWTISLRSWVLLVRKETLFSIVKLLFSDLKPII